MRRVPLPNSQWVDLRDKEEVTVAGRRHIRSISVRLTHALPKLQGVTDETDMATLDLTEEEMDTFFRLQEATVAAFVAAWSLPDPPSIATVAAMPAPMFDALCELTAKDGAALAAATAVPSLTLDTSIGDGVPDPKGLSGVSASSDGPLKVEPEQTPTLT